MTKITILGGTGYTGANIAREAIARGHEVVSYSRNLPSEGVAGVHYETGSLLDDAERTRAVVGADVVIAALAPRGELESALRGVYSRIAEIAAANGVRLGVVGGFSSLRPVPGAPRIAYGNDMPPEYAAEGLAMAEVIEDLVGAAPAELDWFFVSPAAAYGSYVPGEALGTYRLGGDVALFDATGQSAISGRDFAAAILDEVESPAHSGKQFSVAY